MAQVESPAVKRDPPRKGMRTGLLVLLVSGCLVVPLAGVLLIAALIAAVALFNHYESEGYRAQNFTRLVDLEMSESEFAAEDSAPKSLTQFQPQARGKMVRVKLDLNDPYEIPATQPGESIFKPNAELRLVRTDTGAVVRQTSEVNYQYVPSMHWTAEGMQQGIPSEMVIEFEPVDTGSYRVEFKAPAQGFRAYRLLVEQQGV